MRRCPHCAAEIPSQTGYCKACKREIANTAGWGVAVFFAIMIATSLALYGFISQHQKNKSTKADIENKSFSKAKELFICVYRQTDEYLSFFNSNVNEPSLATPRKIDRYISSFSATRKMLSKSIPSLANSQDRELVRSLIALTDDILRHTGLLKKITSHYVRYNHLERKTGSLKGQAKFFRDEEHDGDLADFLDQKATAAQSQAAETKDELTPLAEELDDLTENIFKRMTEFHRKFPRFDFNENTVSL